jgi:hypothetical protein
MQTASLKNLIIIIQGEMGKLSPSPFLNFTTFQPDCPDCFSFFSLFRAVFSIFRSIRAFLFMDFSIDKQPYLYDKRINICARPGAAPE